MESLLMREKEYYVIRKLAVVTPIIKWLYRVFRLFLKKNVEHSQGQPIEIGK